MQESWCSNYVQATYRRWFLEWMEPVSEPNVSESLREIGQDSELILELATGEETGEVFSCQTESSQSKGIFGSPSFIVDGELFWGADRMEDAVS